MVVVVVCEVNRSPSMSPPQTSQTAQVHPKEVLYSCIFTLMALLAAIHHISDLLYSAATLLTMVQISISIPITTPSPPLLSTLPVSHTTTIRHTQLDTILLQPSIKQTGLFRLEQRVRLVRKEKEKMTSHGVRVMMHLYQLCMSLPTLPPPPPFHLPLHRAPLHHHVRVLHQPILH